MNAQESLFIHFKLQNDLAYQHSIKNNDVFNMRLVLRAHGEACSQEAAEFQIKTASLLAD